MSLLRAPIVLFSLSLPLILFVAAVESCAARPNSATAAFPFCLFRYLTPARKELSL